MVVGTVGKEPPPTSRSTIAALVREADRPVAIPTDGTLPALTLSRKSLRSSLGLKLKKDRPNCLRYL